MSKKIIKDSKRFFFRRDLVRLKTSFGTKMVQLNRARTIFGKFHKLPFDSADTTRIFCLPM